MFSKQERANAETHELLTKIEWGSLPHRPQGWPIEPQEPNYSFLASLRVLIPNAQTRRAHQFHLHNTLFGASVFFSILELGLGAQLLTATTPISEIGSQSLIRLGSSLAAGLVYESARAWMMHND